MTLNTDPKVFLLANLPTPPGTKFAKFVGGPWGRFIGDTTADADVNPDFVPAVGTIDFIPEYTGQIKRADIRTSFSLTTISGTLDGEGYLVDANGVRGVVVVASDSPGSPTNIKYTLSININGSRTTVSGVPILADSVVDIQDVTPGAPSQPLFLGVDSILASILLQPDSQANEAIRYLTGGGSAAPAVIDGGKPRDLVSSNAIDGGTP